MKMSANLFQRWIAALVENLKRLINILIETFFIFTAGVLQLPDGVTVATSLNELTLLTKSGSILHERIRVVY